MVSPTACRAWGSMEGPYCKEYPTVLILWWPEVDRKESSDARESSTACASPTCAGGHAVARSLYPLGGADRAQVPARPACLPARGAGRGAPSGRDRCGTG